MNGNPIVFFDGVCGLCSHFVDFVISIDKKHVHRFAPLQGMTAKQILTMQEIEDLDSVVVYVNGGKLKKAQAVLHVLQSVGGFWTLTSVFRIFPNSLLNFFYDLVARHRYQIFGKKESCRIPTKQERALFLD